MGQTGSGKSTLAAPLIADKPHLLIIDPKRQFEPAQEEYSTIHRPEDLPGARESVILYRPTPDDDELESYDRVLRWVYNRKNTFLYIDELLSLVGGPHTYPRYLKILYSQGRALNIGILGATQRPSGVPLFCISESQYFYMFHLSLKRDRQRMAEFMGERVEGDLQDRYSFWYYNQYARSPARELKLRIGATNVK